MGGIEKGDRPSKPAPPCPPPKPGRSPGEALWGARPPAMPDQAAAPTGKLLGHRCPDCSLVFQRRHKCPYSRIRWTVTPRADGTFSYHAAGPLAVFVVATLHPVYEQEP